MPLGLTEEEKKKLDYYCTPEGQLEWRMSDLAWAEYQRLLDKERGYNLNG